MNNRTNFPELLYSQKLPRKGYSESLFSGTSDKFYDQCHRKYIPWNSNNHPWLYRGPGRGYLDVLIRNEELGIRLRTSSNSMKEELKKEEARSGRDSVALTSRPSTRSKSRTLSRPATVASVWRMHGFMSRPVSHQNTRDQILPPKKVDRPNSRSRKLNENLKVNSVAEYKTAGENAKSLHDNKKNTTGPDVQLDKEFQKDKLSGETKPLWYPEDETVQNKTPEVTPAQTPAADSPAMALPGGGMKRESTSLGVYSNLAAHNRQEPGAKSTKPELPRTITSGPEIKLISAIRQSDVALVRRTLYDNPNMKLHFVDKNGKTVLHHCIDVEENRLDMDILRFLLKKDPPINHIDKQTGNSALHNAVKMRNPLCVFTLLKHGANANVQSDKSYRTPLHDAVLQGSKLATCLLLYNGANTGIREKNGRTVTDLLKGHSIEKDFLQVVSLVERKCIEIQEIQTDSMTSFTDIGMLLKPRDSQLSRLPVICKRQNIEDSDTKFEIKSTDDVTSDVYSCRLLSDVDKAPVTIGLCLFERGVSSREDVFVLTGSGETINDVRVESTSHGLQVLFDTCISTEQSFVAVSRQKLERWTVDSQQTSMTSSLDARVNVDVEKNTFTKEAIICLQIHEMSEEADIKEGTILSSTPFYQVDADEHPSRPIKLQIPTPTCFEADGQLEIVQKTQGGTWQQVNHVVNDTDSKTVLVSLKQFPTIIAALMVKKNADPNDLETEVEHSLLASTNAKYTVCFLCMSKRVENSNKFTLVVDCCLTKSFDVRKRFWTVQGFSEHTGKDKPGHFVAVPGHAFKVVFYESAINRKDPSTYELQFHRKRDNILNFEVELKGKTIQFINGRLCIYAEIDVSDTINTSDTGKGNYEARCIAGLDVNLSLNQFDMGSIKSLSNSISGSSITSSSSKLSSAQRSARPSTQRSSRSSLTESTRSARSRDNREQDSMKKLQATLARAMENIDPMTFTDEETTQSENPEKEKEPTNTIEDDSPFSLDDAMLDTLLEGFDEEWYKIFVLMGVSFSDIELELQNTNKVDQIKKQLFRKWRDDQQRNEDVGLPRLMAALFKGGFRHMATSIQVKLKAWYQKCTDHDDPFYGWVTRAYQDSNLLVPSDYPKPMTDPYLVLMSDELPPSCDVARALLLSDTETNQIVGDKHLLNDGIRVMKMLTLYRDRASRTIDAMETLIEVLSDLGYDKIRNYAIMCAKAWVKRTATRKDDPFRYQVHALTNKYDS